MLRVSPGRTAADGGMSSSAWDVNMKTLRIRLPLAALAIAALSAAPAAAATVESAVVPPSNSAAAQYTETFPTSGGDKKTDQKPSHRSPAKVLGKHNAQKLRQQGPEGQAAAEAAAATAPSSIATRQPTHPPSTQNKGGGGGQSTTGKGEANAPQHGQGTDAAKGGTVRPPVSGQDGSSGIGAAIEGATGLSSTGQSGPLLPLAILAAVLWSLAYLWRQRQRVG
jgi:hypothetical protein